MVSFSMLRPMSHRHAQVPHQGLTDQLPPPLLALAPRDSRLPAVLHHAHRQGDVEQQKRPLEDVLHCIDTASVDTCHRRDTRTTQVPEYEAWKDSIGSNASKFSVKYYKGLGTSTAEAASASSTVLVCCSSTATCIVSSFACNI